ncbi:SIS domain-containing protein [Aquipuribacter sp. SD81]|uniref:SIS domain-containing protein n=1 Tax=Aquipuribacter sp. SD81 TaxID=3127703 RepID=UPI003015B27E
MSGSGASRTGAGTAAERQTHMAREVAQQADAVAATFDALLPLRQDLRRMFAGRRHVLFVARGSSDNAAVYGRYLLGAHAGVVASLAAPSLATHYGPPADDGRPAGAPLALDDTLVVCVSQSGATEEIVATQAWAARQGAATVAVANVPGSPLLRTADLALQTQAGPELAVPATKSYLSQLAAMVVLGTALAPDPSALDADIARVPAEVERLVDEQQGVDEAAAALSASRHPLVSGRGMAMGTALEVALKLEETCLRPVRGLSYADLRHGPIAVVDDDVLAVLVSAGDGPLVGAMTELASDLRARGARTVGVGGDAAFADAVDVPVAGPRLPEALAPLGLVVPMQLAIERAARVLGLDPDAPRGLRKVTRTDA